MMLAVGLVLAPSGVTRAHDSWLVAERSWADVGTQVRVSFITGEIFPLGEAATGPDRVASFVEYLGGGQVAIKPLESDAASLFSNVTLTGEGIHVFGLALHPRLIEMTPDAFENYLRQEDARDVLATFMRGDIPNHVTERYSKYAKTLLIVGNTLPGAGHDQIVGHPLEIIPLSPPSTWIAGTHVPVRVLLDGHPWPDVAVSAGHDGLGQHGYAVRTRSDARGEAAIPVSQAGHWFIKAHLIRPHTGLGSFQWESFWASLTFRVAEPPVADASAPGTNLPAVGEAAPPEVASQGPPADSVSTPTEAAGPETRREEKTTPDPEGKSSVDKQAAPPMPQTDIPNVRDEIGLAPGVVVDAPAAEPVAAVQADLDAIVAVHGAPNPWVAAGYRMGRRALQDLRLPKGDRRLIATHHSPYAAPTVSMIDGVQAATGTSVGKMTLRYKTAKLDAVRTEFVDSRTGASVSYRLTDSALRELAGGVDEEAGENTIRVLEMPEEDLFEAFEPQRPKRAQSIEAPAPAPVAVAVYAPAVVDCRRSEEPCAPAAVDENLAEALRRLRQRNSLSVLAADAQYEMIVRFEPGDRHRAAGDRRGVVLRVSPAPPAGLGAGLRQMLQDE